MNEEEQKLAIEGFSKLYLAHLITWAKKNPEEIANSYGEQVTENIKLRLEIDRLSNEIDKAIKILNDRVEYDDGDFESMRFQNDVIKALQGEDNE